MKRYYKAWWERADTGEHEVEFEIEVTVRHALPGSTSPTQDAYDYTYSVLADKHYFKLYELIDGKWVQVAHLYTDFGSLK